MKAVIFQEEKQEYEMLFNKYSMNTYVRPQLEHPEIKSISTIFDNFAKGVLVFFFVKCDRKLFLICEGSLQHRNMIDSGERMRAIEQIVCKMS